MKYKTLGIVIPNYNYAKFLPIIFESINKSSYRDYINIYFIDGLSTDDSYEIAKAYLRDSDIILSETDSGQSDAIQKGLSLCEDDWFIFQNSDDYFDTDTLNYLFTSRMINSNYDALAFSTKFIDDNTCTSFIHSLPIKYGMLYWNIFFCNQSTVYNTGLAKSIGFDTNFSFTLDYDFVVRFFKNKRKVFYSKLILGKQYMHDETKTSTIQHLCLSERKYVQETNFSTFSIIASIPYYIMYVIHKKFFKFSLF